MRVGLANAHHGHVSTAEHRALMYLLRQHVSLDDEEAAGVRYALTFVEMEPVVFDHRILPAHVVAVPVVVDPGPRVVLVQQDKVLDRWHLPWVHVDQTRDPSASARTWLEQTLPTQRWRQPKPEQLWDVAVVPFPAADGIRAHRHLEMRLLFVAPGAVLQTLPAGCEWWTAQAVEAGLGPGAGRLARRLEGLADEPRASGR